MLAQRLRRWPNIKPALGERLVFAGERLTFDVDTTTIFYLTRNID